MEIISHLISYNFISTAMIIGIIIMLIENRKESPRGSEHIAVTVVLLSIIVVNTELKEWFFATAYDSTFDYRDDAAMWFMYIRSAVEHILFPVIAYVLLMMIAPHKSTLSFLPACNCADNRRNSKSSGA
jgi:glycerol uptake facilitator-like aquaporin